MRDANGNYKAYLFVETDAPANITQKAEPFVLAMPIYGADGKTVQKSINIYPKNVKQSDKKTLEEKHKDFTAGEKINYSIETVVPWNIANKKVYTITDNPSKGLIMDADTIQIEGLASNKYTVKKNADNGFTITISAANLAAFAGKTLKTTVKGHLSIEDLTLIDTGIPNKATAKVDNEAHHEVKSEEVFTGGKKFVKVDGSKQSKTLAGAQFQLVIVKNGQVVKYAHGNEKDGYTFDTNNTDVAKKTTGENGQFEFAGLKYSESLEAGESYAVKEVKAPTGYDLLKDPVLFTVAKDSYKTVQAADGQKISNTKKGGFLPSTGGMGIVLFIVAGVVVMAGAAGAMIARRNRRENI
ncbi:SpaH/EbpB family LPXTG-anchored major pilin [Ligilactobacillus ruminis]|uniref:SpaH/EbpB family LPXTG-anchored major pilin n=1 Tax=Ligilactobacillus ruminis TaxID=1623 RepID=UPI002356B36F|nr:SpaH/EbpB family LPXTG-anchored major pilin [Ligilactobacillus ruminis]